MSGLRGTNMLGCDAVEVYLMYDGPGQVTSLLAANVAYEMSAVVAARKKDSG